MVVELQSVVLFEGQAKLEAVVIADSKRRKVVVKWYEKNNRSIPPTDWFDQVKAEVDLQISQERLGRSNLLF